MTSTKHQAQLRKHQTPSSKLQINTNLQIPIPTKLVLPSSVLGLGIWGFSGAWGLDFGACSWLVERRSAIRRTDLWTRPRLFCPSHQFLDHEESHRNEEDGDAGGGQHAADDDGAQNAARYRAGTGGGP